MRLLPIVVVLYFYKHSPASAQKLLSTIGQVMQKCSLMIEDMVKHIDLLKAPDKVIDDMYTECGLDWSELSTEVYKVLIDKADGEAYDKVKSIAAGEGSKAYAVMYKCFTDVSGLGLSEQTQCTRSRSRRGRIWQKV